MRLGINNIGRISSADIQLSGITIVAGENNVGKSTIGKALFALLHHMDNWNQLYTNICHMDLENLVKKYANELEIFCLEHTQAKNRRTNKANALIKELSYRDEIVTAIEDLQVKSEDPNMPIDNLEAYNKMKNYMRTFVQSYIELYQSYDVKQFMIDNAEFIEKWENKIISAFINDLNIDETDLQLDDINDCFNSVFEKQFRKFDTNESQIKFEDDNKIINKLIIEWNNEGMNLSTPIITERGVRFIESPKLFDKIGYNYPFKDLRNSTIRLMEPNSTANFFPKQLSKRDMYVMEENIRPFETLSNGAVEILSKLQNYMGGHGEYNLSGGIKFKDDSLSKPVNATNVSSGLKGLAFLEFAIRVGAIKEGDVVIFDEPEINLHPEWQQLYAEILVEMQIKMKLIILVTSHSPFFIRALEVYSDVKGIMDNLNAYLVEKDKVIDIMHTEYGMTDLYERLTAPFDKLEDILNKEGE